MLAARTADECRFSASAALEQNSVFKARRRSINSNDDMG
jgi:hypothetical protein